MKPCPIIEQSPQLLLSDLEVDRLKIAFNMHSAGDGDGSIEDRPAGAREADENVVYVEDLRDLLRTLFIVSFCASGQATTTTWSFHGVALHFVVACRQLCRVHPLPVHRTM